jgi:AcrR family transcriptional regulator
MKQQKQDRRSQRTRRLVNEAMMELLTEKRYGEITVQDILDRAGIGRSTFYVHYFDKEDVMTSVIEQIVQTLELPMSREGARQEILPSLELFRHMQENHHRLQVMMHGHGWEVVWKAGLAFFSKKIEYELANLPEKNTPTIPLEVVAQYLAGAFANLLKWWLEAGMPYTPEQMDTIFRQLALPGVWASIGRETE